MWAIQAKASDQTSATVGASRLARCQRRRGLDASKDACGLRLDARVGEELRHCSYCRSARFGHEEQSVRGEEFVPAYGAVAATGTDEAGLVNRGTLQDQSGRFGIQLAREAKCIHRRRAAGDAEPRGSKSHENEKFWSGPFDGTDCAADGSALFAQSMGQGQAVVTVLPKVEGQPVPPSVAQQDLAVKVNGKNAKVTHWAPFQAPDNKIELVLLIDERRGTAWAGRWMRLGSL